MVTTYVPRTPARSSSEDIEAGIFHPEEDQTKLAKSSVKTEHLPEYQDGIPPPPYNASTTATSPEEQPWGIRAWFNRHRTFTSWLLGILSLCILGGVITGIMMAVIFVPCGSDCGEAVYYRADQCPLAREDLLRKEAPTSTLELPRPTGFAPGDPHRLVYTNVGGRRPVVGSSFTVVIQPRYSYGDQSHRVFYHDRTGQIYETAIISSNRGYEEHSEAHAVRGAVMAVNTSLAAAVATKQVNGQPYYTTALYFHPQNDTTHIGRVLTDSPGTYGVVDVSPFRSFSNWLAATAAGSNILLAYREEDYTAIGNGWWNDTDHTDVARHSRNIHVHDAMADGQLSLTTARTDFIPEGFVLAYQRVVDDKLQTVFQYGNISEYFRRPPPALHSLPHESTSWPALDVMPPNFGIGDGHFSVVQLRGGNLTYDTFSLKSIREDGGPGSGAVKISHETLRRKDEEQAYYCVFGDQPIAEASHYTEFNRQPPLWDFIPYSPLKGVDANGLSWLYMLRIPKDETQGARLTRFSNYAGSHSPPVFKEDVPLFAVGNVTSPETIVTSFSTATITSTTASVAANATEAAAESTTPTPTPLREGPWPCLTDEFGMCRGSL